MEHEGDSESKVAKKRAMNRVLEEILEELREFATPTVEMSIESRCGSIPYERILKPNMPIGVFLQEAFNLYCYSQIDKEMLCSKGLDWRLMEELPKRIDHLRKVEGELYSAVNHDVPSAAELKRVFDLVDASRKELLAAMEFALKGTAREKIVAYINSGSGSADYTQDLNDIAVTAENEKEKLEEVGCDLHHIEVIRENSPVYSNLIAACTIERRSNLRIYSNRNRAYTFLFVAVHEIRRAARHAFWYDAKRLNGYASRHFRKASKKGKTRKPKEKEAK